MVVTLYIEKLFDGTYLYNILIKISVFFFNSKLFNNDKRISTTVGNRKKLLFVYEQITEINRYKNVNDLWMIIYYFC